MLRNLKEFHYPKTVPEALAILERFDSKAAVVAGCTSLGRVDDAKLEAAVDITRMGLSYVKEDKDFIRLGATTTYETLARTRRLQTFAGGMLAKAASACPSHLLRNGMTLGGSTVLATPASELPPALLALDAEFVIAGVEEQVIPAAQFFAEPEYRQLGRRAMLTEVRIPRALAGWRSGYATFSRSRSDPAIAIAAVLLQEDEDGKCAGARVVVGGICRHATRSATAEKKLVGKSPGPSQFEQAGRAALKDLEAISDWRASKEYRVHIAEVLVRRTLAACWEGTKGGAR